MKVKVLLPFTDKRTGKEYKKNETLEMSAKRFVEITGKGKFVQPIDEAAPKSSKKE
jgi:hypothetical protein